VLLALWGLALLLPRPEGGGAGKSHGHWPPRNFCVYYGRWDHAKIARAWAFDLIIAHPGKKMEGFNRDLVDRLRSGLDGLPGSADDRVVLAYLSLGEDEDPPAGPGPIPRRYLDQVSYRMKDGFPAAGPDGLPEVGPGHDGIPDRNGAWGSYFVDPGDAEWRRIVSERAQRLAQRGVDGFFLDTVDVRPELRADMMALIEHLHQRHPGLYWVSNRGVDLLQQFPGRFLACLDGVVLESWFTQWNWSWGRATVSPYYAENQRILEQVLRPQKGLCKLYLDYLDPQQPDRGALLARRRDFTPAFWSHPFLDRLEESLTGSPQSLAPLPEMSAQRSPEGLIELPLESDCEAIALAPGGEFPLPGLRGPWAVGAASALRLRRVDPSGRVSPARDIPVPGAGPPWVAPWSVMELDDSLEFRWQGGELAQVWLGPRPGEIRPVPVRGLSPLRLSGLERDQLYWVSLSQPGGAPDRVCPARTHDITPPPPPAQVKARYHGDFLTVSWSPVVAEDLAGYRVYVSRPGNPLALPYQVVSSQVHFEVRLPAHAYRVHRVLVTSFDSGNHESLPSAPARLEGTPAQEAKQPACGGALEFGSV
jgi:hypothetical protein